VFNRVRHKKFLLSAIFTAVALTLAISTIVSSKSSPADSISEDASAGNPRLSADAGEIAATLPLFHRVDESYIRGSQPLRGGIETLTRLGVRTVVDLRSIYDHNDDVMVSAARAGLAYEWVPMSVWNPPTNEEASRFVSIVTDSTKGPFFVFCADGLNRTGEMTAIYRVANNKWSVEKALEEADELGFNPYYYNLRGYVWDYARTFRPSAVPPTGRRVSPLEP
jgi:protein tyrosine/serine phosphatase